MPVCYLAACTALLVGALWAYDAALGFPRDRAALPSLIGRSAIAYGLISLLIIWAVLGASPWPLRLIAGTLAVPAFSVLGPVIFRGVGDSWGLVTTTAPKVALLVAVLCACRPKGLRVLRAGSVPSQVAPPRFALRDLLLWIGALAVLFAAARLLVPHQRLIELGLVFTGLAGACSSMGALAAMWMAFGDSKLTLRLLAVPGLAALSGGLAFYCFRQINGLVVFASSAFVEICYVALALFVFRLSGYRVAWRRNLA